LKYNPSDFSPFAVTIYEPATQDIVGMFVLSNTTPENLTDISLDKTNWEDAIAKSYVIQNAKVSQNDPIYVRFQTRSSYPSSSFILQKFHNQRSRCINAYS
jgi:hypothetical protein